MRPIHAPRRRALVAALGVALLAGAAPAAHASDPAVLRLLGSSPTYASSVEVQKAGGGTFRVRPARYLYRVTRGGTVTQESGFCVDTSHYILTGRDYDVLLQTAADAPEMAGDDYREAGWLVARADALIAAAPDAQREAGALQVAVWQLTGQVADVPSPTGDASLNARVRELRALADGRRLPDALEVDVAGDRTCTAETATVTVTGTPGAEVDLTASSPATVTPARVVIGDTGVATAELTSPDATEVTVTARASAPVPTRLTKLPGATAPQDQLVVRPGQLVDTDLQPFVRCDLYTYRGPAGTPFPVTTLPSPTPPPADPAPAPEPPPPAAPLAVAFGGSAVAAPGGLATYRIRVVNRGRSVIRGARVVQRLEDGIVPLRARGARASVGRRSVEWTLPPLAPGRSASLTTVARVPRGLMGDVGRSRVTVRGAGATLTAGKATAVVRPVGKTEQGF